MAPKAPPNRPPRIMSLSSRFKYQCYGTTCASWHRLSAPKRVQRDERNDLLASACRVPASKGSAVEEAKLWTWTTGINSLGWRERERERGGGTEAKERERESEGVGQCRERSGQVDVLWTWPKMAPDHRRPRFKSRSAGVPLLGIEGTAGEGAGGYVWRLRWRRSSILAWVFTPTHHKHNPQPQERTTRVGERERDGSDWQSSAFGGCAVGMPGSSACQSLGLSLRADAPPSLRRGAFFPLI